ncbi:hypothetical protein FDZ71_12705, partial [bacterium]
MGVFDRQTVAAGENNPSQTITRAGTQASINGSAEYFTGTVRIDPLFPATDTAPFSGAYVTFEPGATATSAQAAEAIGCELGQVVKSLVLMADGAPVLALVAGDRRADRKAIALEAAAKRAWFAEPDAVLAAGSLSVSTPDSA